MTCFAFQEDLDIKGGESPRSRGTSRCSTLTLPPPGASDEPNQVQRCSTITLPPPGSNEETHTFPKQQLRSAAEVRFMLPGGELPEMGDDGLRNERPRLVTDDQRASLVDEVVQAVEARLEVVSNLRYAEFQERQRSLEVSLADAEKRFAQQLLSMNASLSEESVATETRIHQQLQGIEIRCSERFSEVDSNVAFLLSQHDACHESQRRSRDEDSRFNDQCAAVDVVLKEARRAIDELVAIESQCREQIALVESRCSLQALEIRCEQHFKRLAAEYEFGNNEQKHRIADAERRLRDAAAKASHRTFAASPAALPTSPPQVPVGANPTANPFELVIVPLEAQSTLSADVPIEKFLAATPRVPIPAVESATQVPDDFCTPLVAANPSSAFFGVGHRLKAAAKTTGFELTQTITSVET